MRMTKAERWDWLMVCALRKLPQHASLEEKQKAIAAAKPREVMKVREEALWQHLAAQRLKPQPKVIVRGKKVDCGWCGNAGCIACFNARNLRQPSRREVKDNAGS